MLSKTDKTYMTPFWRENKLVKTQKEGGGGGGGGGDKAQKRAHDLENQMQGRVQGKVQLKDSICFKWV
jgi:hypothetical protein